MGSQTFVTVDVRLLEVMSRLCYYEPDRPIANMLFRPREIVAVNGHILARVAMDLGLFASPFGIRRRDIEAVVGAANAVSSARVDLFDAGDFVEFRVFGPGVYRTKKMDISQYPNVDQVTPTKQSEGTPPHITFDPKYLRDVAELVDVVHGYRTGVKVVSWDGLNGPVLFEAVAVRVVLMPMRGTESDNG